MNRKCMLNSGDRLCLVMILGSSFLACLELGCLCFNDLLSICLSFEMNLFTDCLWWVKEGCTVNFHCNKAAEVSHVLLMTTGSKFLAPVSAGKALENASFLHLLLKELAVNAVVNLKCEWSESKTT